MASKLTQYTILLTDDEPQNLKYLFDTLSKENYNIIIAPNGKIATDLAVEQQPDAIIMDWDMPEMNGVEATKHIRENEQTKHIPIIMATGAMTSTENLKTALQAGANDYIRKPFDTIEIIARINSMINQSIEHKKNILLQQTIAEQKIKFLEIELEQNTSALSIAKLQLIEKGQYQTKLIDDLQELKIHVSESGYHLINQIISYCKTSKNKINWQELEILFEKVHHSFYNKLQIQFPGLTKNEKKICALIKLNLSTKEIAIITNKNIDAIKKAKNRLKAKLKLNKIESLYNTIQSIN